MDKLNEMEVRRMVRDIVEEKLGLLPGSLLDTDVLTSHGATSLDLWTIFDKIEAAIPGTKITVQADSVKSLNDLVALVV